MWVLQHRLAVALVAAAALVTAGVFTLARPEYRPPNRGGELVTFPEAVPPAHGWRWDDPTPGFHLGDDGGKWNIYGLEPRDIPEGAGVLTAGRFTLHGRPEVIYSKNGCIGFATTAGVRRLLCTPKSPVVLMAYAGKPYEERKGTLYPLSIIGVARSDVTRVTLHTRADTYVDVRSGTPVVRYEGPVAVYSAKQNLWWGAFESNRSQPVPWDATVNVFGEHRRLASLRIRFSHPGEAVYCPTATSVSCR